jgi:hypothetical protein
VGRIASRLTARSILAEQGGQHQREVPGRHNFHLGLKQFDKVIVEHGTRSFGGECEGSNTPQYAALPDFTPSPTFSDSSHKEIKADIRESELRCPWLGWLKTVVPSGR